MKINIIDLEIKKDKRGFLVQNEDINVSRRMKHFFFSFSNKGVVRGQHYHKRKTEWFLVARGKAEIVFKDLKSDDKKIIKVDGEKPQMVEVPPMIAHSIINTDDSEMYLLAMVDEPLDPDNPDTYPYKVV